MKINITSKTALIFLAFVLIIPCVSSKAADWKQQVKSGKIVSEGTITEDTDKDEITTILRRQGYKDLEVVGGDVAWVAPDNKGMIYFKADCITKKGGTAIAEGWTDYFNPKKYKITKVTRTTK
jgi:hypothetical protein